MWLTLFFEFNLCLNVFHVNLIEFIIYPPLLCTFVSLLIIWLFGCFGDKNFSDDLFRKSDVASKLASKNVIYLWG